MAVGWLLATFPILAHGNKSTQQQKNRNQEKLFLKMQTMHTSDNDISFIPAFPISPFFFGIHLACKYQSNADKLQL